MIIDFKSNNNELFDYVKKKYGGRIVDKEGCKKLMNIPIGLESHFKSDLEEFMIFKNIDSKKDSYFIYDPRGNLI